MIGKGAGVRAWVGAAMLAVLLAAVARAADPPPARRALLVGCTDYPFLPDRERWRLIGPTHDVDLMRQVLARFGFDAAQIATLKDWPADEAMRPTRANIERHFQRLAQAARPGDQVVILMSGHGSQQPASPASIANEPDGLDEIFLPADVKGWNGQKGSIENAIVDDELEAWLTAIRTKGALVWIIFDCCHAGTMTRGNTQAERYRYVPATALVPSPILAAAQKRAATQPAERKRGQEAPAPAPAANTLVAMYACQSTELAPEMLLPVDSDRYQGLFTYTLCQTLLRASTPMTYRELAERVVATYRGMDRWQPTPLIDGGALDRQALGVKEWPDRPQLLLGKGLSGGRVELLGGGLVGIRPLSILAAYPPAGAPNADKPVGHVRVVKTSAMSSVVEPVAYASLPKPAADALPAGSRCKPAFVDYGDLRMRLAVQTQADAAGGGPIATHAAGKGPAAIEAGVAAAEKDARLIERVADPAKADWFVRVVGDRVCLVPSAGWDSKFAAGAARAGAAPAQFLLGTTADGAELAGKLKGALARIARARQLLQLANAGETARGGEAAVGVEIELLSYRDETDPAATVMPYGPEGRRLKADQWIAFRVRNPGRLAVDVTLLFVDSGYGVSALFPPAGTAGDNRLEPGKSFTTPRLKVTAETVGAEQVVAIAVRAGRQHVDFTCLEQPTLERARGKAGAVEALDSPFGRLIQSAVYGDGATRGLAASEVQSYSVRLLPWVTVPSE